MYILFVYMCINNNLNLHILIYHLIVSLHLITIYHPIVISPNLIVNHYLITIYNQQFTIHNMKETYMFIVLMLKLEMEMM
jgi:hypothetical protein